MHLVFEPPTAGPTPRFPSLVSDRLAAIDWNIRAANNGSCPLRSGVSSEPWRFIVLMSSERTVGFLRCRTTNWTRTF